MWFRSLMLATVFTAVPALPQFGNALLMNESDDEPQPGIIRLAGVGEGDMVTLDGEPIPVDGLRRSRYNLLIAPGIYTLKVRSGETGRTCTSRVVVAEERVVEPSCARPSGVMLVQSRPQRQATSD